MNEITTPKYDSVEEAVSAGAAIFADVEDALEGVAAKLRSLKGVFDAVAAGGHLGGIEAAALSLRARAMGVKMLADVFELHAQLTERAKEKGIDLPAPRSGGGR